VSKGVFGVSSKRVQFRVSEAVFWKLEQMGRESLGGVSAELAAKYLVTREILPFSDDDTRRFQIEVLRPKLKAEREAAGRAFAPTMVAVQPAEKDPLDVPLHDSNGWPLCPECRESSMLDDGVIVRSVGIIESATGWFQCHRRTCKASYDYPPFIGQPETNRGEEQD
jgi:hypothetical protein